MKQIIIILLGISIGGAIEKIIRHQNVTLNAFTIAIAAFFILLIMKKKPIAR